MMANVDGVDVATTAAVLLADAAAVLLFTLLTPSLVARFHQASPLQPLSILASYLVFCASVWGLRRLESGGPGCLGTTLMAGLAVFFGVFVVVMIVESSGFFARLDDLPTDLGALQAAKLMLIVAVGLALAFLYFATLTIEVPVAVPKATLAHAVWTGVTALGINWMCVVTAAHWEAFAADSEPATGLALGGKILVFAVVYVFFLLFYAPPRLLVVARAPGLLTVAAFFAQTGYLVWRTLARSAW